MTEALFILLQEACLRHVRVMHLSLVKTDMKFAIDQGIQNYTALWLIVRYSQVSIKRAACLTTYICS